MVAIACFTLLTFATLNNHLVGDVSGLEPTSLVPLS